MPAGNTPSRRATGTPHPGRCSVDWPKAACTAGVSGLEPPEPSTRNARWPGHRPSSTAERSPALPQRSRRRVKRCRGSLARA